MTNNISTEGLNGIALEIVNTINSLNSSIDNIKECSDNIKVECEKLKYYNKQKVSGSTSLKKQYFESGENKGEYKNTLVTYKIWQIEGQEELGENCRNLEQQLEEAKESISLLKLETEDIELIADTIDNYIMSIQEELGENIDTSILASAFGTLSSTIAFNSYNASTGNFVDTKQILSEYWTDKALHFKRNPDGTYTIYQKDENGNEVAMGYTTAITAALYMKELKSESTKLTNAGSKSKNIKITDKDGNVLYEGTTGKAPDNSNQDIKITDKDGNVLYENNGKDTSSSTNASSQTSKEKISATNPLSTFDVEEDFISAIDNEENITIPDNVDLYVNGKPVYSKSLFYDKESGKYRNQGSTYINDNVGYTKEDLYGAVFSKI